MMSCASGQQLLGEYGKADRRALAEYSTTISGKKKPTTAR
jgi:hypothetical protein